MWPSLIKSKEGAVIYLLRPYGGVVVVVKGFLPRKALEIAR